MQNYDYNLNGVFASTGLSTGFKDLKRFLSLPKEADPDIYMVVRQAHQPAVGNDLGETMGQPTPSREASSSLECPRREGGKPKVNIIAKSYQLMVATGPDAVLVLGVLRRAQQPTNSCLSVIGAKVRQAHLPRLSVSEMRMAA